MLYEHILNKLRENPPVPESPQRITDNIMNLILKNHKRPSGYFFVNFGPQQWELLYGFRFLITTAAVLLFGFFILEQINIRHKLETLEQQVSASGQHRYTSSGNDIISAISFYPEIIEQGHIQAVSKDEIQISRKSLNYILYRMKKLEEENESFRDKLQEQYFESLQNNKSNEKPNR